MFNVDDQAYFKQYLKQVLHFLENSSNLRLFIQASAWAVDTSGNAGDDLTLLDDYFDSASKLSSNLLLMQQITNC